MPKLQTGVMKIISFKCNNVAMLRAKFSDMLCICEAQVCPHQSLY
jgi:hypothetical protein